MNAAANALDRLAAAARGIGRGEISPASYAWIRVGLAALFLLRVSDVFRPWIDWDHHLWVEGVDWSAATQARAAPRLDSPLLPGFSIFLRAADLLNALRIAGATLLLVGVLPRLCAATVALASFALMGADRYHYFHHLYLLYVSLAWLAFCPSGDALTVVPRTTPPRWAPAWPLTLLRAHVCAVYAAAGASKLNATWLSGESLFQMERAGLAGGHLWQLGVGVVGHRGLGWLSCLVELGLACALPVARWRLAAVGVAVLFHAFIEVSMMVSTFGLTSIVLLSAFLPWRARDEREPDAALSGKDEG